MVREKSLENEIFSRSGNFCLSQGNWKKMTMSGKVREFQNFLKTEMAMAVFNFQKHKFTELALFC